MSVFDHFVGLALKGLKLHLGLSLLIPKQKYFVRLMIIRIRILIIIITIIIIIKIITIIMKIIITTILIIVKIAETPHLANFPLILPYITRSKRFVINHGSGPILPNSCDYGSRM